MMSYDKVKQANSLVTGIKQTRKAIERQLVTHVIVAEDADLSLTEPIVKLCEVQNVPYTFVASMRELGKISGIQVGTAAVAILKS